MKVDINTQEVVTNKEYVPFNIEVSNLHSDATKAKIFINGSMTQVPVYEGRTYLEVNHFIEYGDNKVQIDITCKGEYAQFSFNILNQHKYALEYFLTKNSMYVDDGKQTRIIDCDYRPFDKDNAFMNVNILRHLGGEIGLNTTEDGHAWCSVMLNGNSMIFYSDTMEININGNTKKINQSPRFVRGGLYIPIYELGDLVDWLTVKKTADGFKIEVVL